MKTNDLRIGNLVLNEDGGVCKLFNIHEGYINHKPIPLTEEWLLKFGFTKNSQFDFDLYEVLKHKDEYNEFGYGSNEMQFAICLEDNIEFQIEHHRYFDNKRLDPQNICIPIRHIKYVHQLQNLYFALTGEELEVKQ